MKPRVSPRPDRTEGVPHPQTAKRLHLRLWLGLPSRGVFLGGPLLPTLGPGNSVASACSLYTRSGFSSALLLSSSPGGNRT